MKPTVLFITPGPTIGVRSPLYQSHYKGLSRKYRGYIVTTSYEKGELSIGDFTYLPMKFTPSRLRAFKFVLYCVWRALVLRARKQRVDLVSSYDPLLTGIIGVITSRILGARLVLEVNGVYTSPFQWVDAPANLPTKIKRRVYPTVMRFVLKKSHGIRLLFPGQLGPLQDLARGKLVRAFPCFVPTAQFRDIRDEKVVFFSGFPFKLKGVDVLIDAFKLVAPTYPDWKLKILGWFPNPKELHDAIGGHPQIFHHKPVHHSEMVEHIGSCAIVVQPSRTEAMGRVLVEAMAAGKPRIGSNVDGIPYVIADGVDGLLCEPGDAQDLAAKLDILMGDAALRRSFGEAGRLRVKTEFSQETFLRSSSEFYDRVLGN